VSNADNITIELAPSATDEVRALIGELDRELAGEYSAEQRHGLTLEAIFQPMSDSSWHDGTVRP
jgi:hypothetical protein